mgnify:CR=1 FL=1
MKIFNKNFGAFTLAEVLITLGILGVVAAITLPSVVSNHKKLETAVRLKHAFALFSNAFRQAESEYGNAENWGVTWVYDREQTNATSEEREAVVNASEKLYQIAIKPNLKIVKDYGSKKTPNDIGYNGPISPKSGKKNDSAPKAHWFVLENGILAAVGVADKCEEYETHVDEEENPVTSCTNRKYKNLTIWVDINGFRGPNTYGKDFFIMYLNSATNKFDMHAYNPGSGVDHRRKFLDECNTDSGSQYCGKLIELDGWQIKDDYPWF